MSAITHQVRRPPVLLGLSTLCGIASVFGLFGWLRADWFMDPGPYPSDAWHGYHAGNFVGLFFFTFFTSISVALSVVAVTQGARSRYIQSALRWNSLRVGLGLAYVVVGITAIFSWSFDVMQCLGAFCVGPAWQHPKNVRPLAGEGWLSIIGAAAFFSLVPIGCILMRASWNALDHPSAIKNTPGHGASVDSTASPLLAGSGMGSHTGSSKQLDVDYGTAPAASNNNNNNHNSNTGLLNDDHSVNNQSMAEIRITGSNSRSGMLKPVSSGASFNTDGGNNNSNNTKNNNGDNNNNQGQNNSNNDSAHPLLTEEQLHFDNLMLPSMSRKYFFMRTFAILVTLFMFFITTLYIPNSWEYFTASRIAANANQVATNEYTGPNGTCSYGSSADAGPLTCTDYTWAVFPTGNLVLSRDLVLKIYPGNVFFFAYLALMLLGGAFVHVAMSKSGWFTRVRFLLDSSELGWRFTYAEITGWLLTVLMMTLFSIYWFHDHNFNTSGGAFSTGLARSERVARGFGQIAVAFMGLLLFPSSRNSILHSTLGTSWESLLRVHRIFGYCMLICTLIHMISWWVKYAEDGAFPANIIQVPLSVGASADNFTVPITSWSTWVLIVCMLVLAYEPVRRRWFEIFYYSHLFAAYAAIPAVLWHAAAGWEYLLPGVTVWFIDRLVRFSRSSRIVTVLSTKVCDDGVTEIRFQQPGLVVRPGQYVFLNVAELSLLQWHPFSVSSVDNINHVFTLHIKAMPSADEGTRTWTHELRSIVQKNTSPLTASVDGPYGPLHELEDFDCVILVAGGIGITPCAAIAQSLRQNPDGIRVECHWCLRQPELAADFANQLSPTGAENPNFSTTLYCSRPSATADELSRRSGGFTVKAGRPNWDHLFKDDKRDAYHLLNHDPARVLVFACGPAQLVDECAKAAIEAGFTFHEETFFL